jgi:hypothetical protein
MYMKKALVFILALLTVASAFVITALADEPSSGTVIRISAVKREGPPVVILEEKSFENGWNEAMKLASSKKEFESKGYVRIVVDIYADWKSNAKGEFGDSGGLGFNESTIYTPANAKLTVNLNGHTIDRDLKKLEYDGEVICIANYADVIINGGTIIKKGDAAGNVMCGTIKGGWSCNGAGGIHIGDHAAVVLNNVHVIDNAVEDDKGAGIAVYDNSTLVINGGSISNNRLDVFFDTFERTEGALYADNATVVLNDVIISGNYANNGEAMGVAVSLNSSAKVTLNRCYVFDNASADGQYLHSLFYLDDSDSELVINNSYITNNGRPVYSVERRSWSTAFASNGKLTLNNCEIIGNKTYMLIPAAEYSSADDNFNDCVIKDNVSSVVGGRSSDFRGAKHTFTNCKFDNNFPIDNAYYKKTFEGHYLATVKLVDCEIGDSTFDDDEYIQLVNSARSRALSGSIFGSGSIASITTLSALAISIASITVSLISCKKRYSKTEEEN